MRRRSSNDRTLSPIWKDICPCKSSIWRLTLSNSSVVDFYPLTRDFNWNPELFLWRAGGFFYNRSLPVSSFETIWMWFLQNLVFISEPHGFLRPLFFEYLAVRFPNSGYVSNSVLKCSLHDWRTLFASVVRVSCRSVFCCTIRRPAFSIQHV